MKLFTFLLFFTCMLVFFSGSAQEADNTDSQGSLDSGTIENQFEYLNSISNNYEEYKVVKKVHLDKIKSNITDSLNVFKDQLVTISSQLKDQKSALSQLNTELKQSQGELQTALDMKESFYFLGMYIPKSAYNTLVWGIIILLLVSLFFFIYRFKRSYSVITEVKQSLIDTKEEFDTHRRNTLERERKLNRQLVDEMNKRKI